MSCNHLVIAEYMQRMDALEEALTRVAQNSPRAHAIQEEIQDLLKKIDESNEETRKFHEMLDHL